MYRVDVEKKWIGGHQPILDFHTGVIAKIWTIWKKNGIIVFHDLDTLEEKGSISLKIPINQKDFKHFSLLETIPSKKKLFTIGPVKVKKEFREELLAFLISLAAGEIPRHHLEDVKERIIKLQSIFGGREFRTIAHLNRDLLWFILPRLGVWVRPSWMLSELLLKNERWKRGLRQTVALMKKFSPKSPPFWRWDKENFQRHPITNWKEAEKLLLKGELIPRRLALSCLLRCVGAKGVVRGPGQERYETEFLKRLHYYLGPKFPSVITVASQQGVPPIWRKKSPETFRPSALLLWLMGGQFEPRGVYIKSQGEKEKF